MKILSVAAILAALTLTGCAGAQTPVGNTGKQSGIDADKAAKYVKCMRDEGVPLRANTDGQGDDGIELLDPNVPPEKLQAAEKACAKFDPMPKGPKEGSKEWDRLVKYTQCLRENGVDVEDPKPGDPGVRMNGGDPATQERAEKACKKHAPGR